MCSEPVFLHSGPTYAYYYVEILLVNSGNASGVFNIDVYDEYMEQLKFAEFKKIDRGRGAVGLACCGFVSSCEFDKNWL